MTLLANIIRENFPMTYSETTRLVNGVGVQDSDTPSATCIGLIPVLNWS